MGTNDTTTTPGAFAYAVRAEVLAELGRRGITPNSLAKHIGRGPTYINARLKNAHKELTLNDLEAICTYIGADLNTLMDRATRAYEQAILEDAAKLSDPHGYDLAAGQQRPDVPEETP